LTWLPQENVGLGLTGVDEAFGQVQASCVSVHSMHLQTRAIALYGGPRHDPPKGGGAEAAPLEGGRNFDQLQPDVAITRSQIDSATRCSPAVIR